MHHITNIKSEFLGFVLIKTYRMESLGSLGLKEGVNISENQLRGSKPELYSFASTTEGCKAPL